MSPEVSIVIPHFNRVALLKETLESVCASRFSSYEVIVVDDGSDSECRGDLASLTSERVRVLDSEGQKGPSGARNTGARHAKGEFLIFLDSDDILASWCIEQRMKWIHDFPENDLWIFPVLLFREYPGDHAILWNDMESGDDVIRFVQSDPPWHTSSPIWRRSAFLELGGFNERIIYGDDSDLHLRALFAESRLAKFPDELPDVFIRRSNQDRITSGMKADILASRLTRLCEMSRLLRAHASADLSDSCEGQYFVECEFLLFNADSPTGSIDRVLEAWRSAYPSSTYRKIARSYFNLAIPMRDHAYLGVRILRRAVRVLLPAAFFPTGGGIEATPAAPTLMKQINEKLDQVA
jgi:glycosyltransferase involved in cell wall biosynthesis